MQICRNSALTLEIHYPIRTTLTVTQRVWDQLTDHVISRSHVDAATTLDALDSYSSGPTYYFDSATGWFILFSIRISLPTPTAVAGRGYDFHRCFVCVSVIFRTISQKPMQEGTPNLACKCSTMSSGNPFILRVKRLESQKQSRRGCLHSCECWLLLIAFSCFLIAREKSRGVLKPSIITNIFMEGDTDTQCIVTHIVDCWTASSVCDSTFSQFVTDRQTDKRWVTSYTALSPVHTSNNVEATLSNATSRTLLRHCCLFGNDVERVLREISSCSVCFNNIEAAFEIIERIVRLVAFDNIASTLLLVWTGL